MKTLNNIQIDRRPIAIVVDIHPQANGRTLSSVIQNFSN